jgi:putative DNA primase/helicase
MLKENDCLMRVRRLALDTIARGISPVPVPQGGKGPNIKDWQDLRITSATVDQFFDSDKLNVGALMGPASGDLSDVDLDCKEAVALAPHFLPRTGSIYGRPSKRRSHYLYRCTDAEPKAVIKLHDERKTGIVELRLGGGGKGAQSLMPGSLHPSDERYEWDVDGQPATASCATLKDAITKIAVGTILIRHWPPRGGQHDAALTVGGFLARAGWNADDVESFVTTITKVHGEAELPHAHGRTARDSVESHARGVEVRGLPAMIETFGDDVAKQVAKLVRYGAVDDTGPAGRELATDLGNARRLVRLHGERIRYVHAWKSWLVWEDGHWQRDKDASIERMAKATVEDMHAEASRVNDEAKRTELRKHALKSQNAQRFAAMVQLAESEIEVVLAAEKLDADPYLLGVQNGVVDLRTGKFRAATRDDLVTKRAGVAFKEGATCPSWKALLDKIFLGDAELIAYFQRIIGYGLTGLTVEEVLFMLWGAGANGKSTVRETIVAMMGDYAAGSDASLLITNKQGGATPDLARLHGKRLVTINETEQKDKLNEARMKYITGHDVITARNLFEGFFDFHPTHKTWMATNHKPIVRSTDLGTWRRIHLLPFLYVFPEAERDKHYRAKVLMPELPGILNWAIDGLLAYHKQGLKPPTSVVNATREYQQDMDIVGRWIEERCALDPGAVLKATDLFDDYKYWAESEFGFSTARISFYRDLIDRGFKMERSHGMRRVRGLKLSPFMPGAG